jgi:hypothetical protein
VLPHSALHGAVAVLVTTRRLHLPASSAILHVVANAPSVFSFAIGALVASFVAVDFDVRLPTFRAVLVVLAAGEIAVVSEVGWFLRYLAGDQLNCFSYELFDYDLELFVGVFGVFGVFV